MEKVEKVQNREEEDFTTFEDVFTLALANTKSGRFIADSNAWHRVLYQVCENYQEKITQLTTR